MAGNSRHVCIPHSKRETAGQVVHQIIEGISISFFPLMTEKTMVGVPHLLLAKTGRNRGCKKKNQHKKITEQHIEELL